jgi:DNA repair protein RecO (recombination protein O)
LRLATSQDAAVLSGQQWQALSLALVDKDFPRLLTHLTAEPKTAQALKNQLRALLNYHCGQPLKTPQMMTVLQQL